MENPHSSEGITPILTPAVEAANETLAQMRLSMDSNGSSSRSSSPAPTKTNGNTSVNDLTNHSKKGEEFIKSLQEELRRTKQENESLTLKYNNLVAKLATMRTSVEAKLKRDAEELDRQEQVIQQLTLQSEDYVNTIETLKEELIQSNIEADRSSRELEGLRAKVFQDSAQEAVLRERELHDLQNELEQCRIERDEFEQALMEEKVILDNVKNDVTDLKKELLKESEMRMAVASDLEKERERSSNLQMVLEDFQAAKDHELEQIVREYKEQLQEAILSLAEFKSRALRAEAELQETSTNAERTAILEKEAKEKTLLIGKLRHEAIILNEHLTEAIRRLRRDASDNNVDKRLVTNVLLSFLTTPRNDTKRFEMLSLLSSVLSWTDAEREKAGLQRGGTTAAMIGKGNKGKSLELDRSEETESFSKMWVEFLLKESSQGTNTSTSVTSPSSPTSPKLLPLPSTPGLNSAQSKMARVASYAGSGAHESNSEHTRQPLPRRESSAQS
ncbi:hypothetical protein Clacol_009264 [Clathrus columnatus]|uniref:GRIP domain-containing protein n=1 Tax=Clathrus columnatus TaxID=1419009 RepID=A0AAV5AQL0_9AGAM|nr:hypothetical protein Clacol_009264 [Clathrus columnatus]